MLQTCFQFICFLSLTFVLSSGATPVFATPIAQNANNKANTEIFRATYKGDISGWNVTLVRTLTQHGDNEFTFSSHAKNFFASMSETSRFSINNNTPSANNYTYKRSIAGKKTTETILFDWNNNTASYQRDNKPNNGFAHTLKPGLLDPSLYQLFLQANTALSTNKLNYSFVKRRRIENYKFKKLDNEIIQVGNKDYDSIVVARDSTAGPKQTKVWIIPSLGYQIGKIRHTGSNGDTSTISLTEYQGNASHLNAFYSKVALSTPKPSTPASK